MNDQSFAKLKGFISWWPGSWTFYNPYVKEMAKEIWFTQVIWKKKRILKVYCLTYFYEVNTPQSCSKLRKEYIKTVYCYLAYLTSMQNISCEMLGGWLIAGIKIAGRNINNFRYVDDTTLMAES